MTKSKKYTHAVLAMLLAAFTCACTAQAAPPQVSSSAKSEVVAPATSSSQQAVQSAAPKSTAKPAPSVALSEKQVELGEVLTIRVKNGGVQKATATTNFQFIPTFYADGKDQIALLPFAYGMEPGSYALAVNVGSKKFSYVLEVSDRKFEIQQMTIDESTANSTNTSAANIEWETKIEPLKLVGDAKRYWSKPFLQPVQGELTTDYGSKRYTNGSKVASRHSGIDIAAKTGTIVPASNDGRVQFAGYLQLTGNTVVIEHGHGLKSFYYHMDSTTIKTDDMVKQGQQVGTVGSTGYSTGPHLHYAMTVNSVFINPWSAFKEDYLK